MRNVFRSVFFLILVFFFVSYLFSLSKISIQLLFFQHCIDIGCAGDATEKLSEMEVNYKDLTSEYQVQSVTFAFVAMSC